MSALAQQFPAEHMHVADLPYRLSSWALDDPANVGLWVDSATGELAGWAVTQLPFWTIDVTCRPDVAPDLVPPMLAWADDRAQQLLATPDARPLWFVTAFSSQQERLAAIEEAGFACQSDVGEDSLLKVWLARAPHAPLLECAPPSGITIRPLAGRQEVDAYVALHQTVFESKSMRSDWRARMLEQPEYLPELDLVAVNGEGELVAFCICWLDTAISGAHPWGQVEPLGVLPGYRGAGLGKAMLSAGLRRLRDVGAEAVYAETDKWRNAAFGLYEWAGFRLHDDVLVYRKDYP